MVRSLVNSGIVLCLLTLVGLNLASNPFSPNAYASESACEGDPPNSSCYCCENCGCWICD